MPAIPKIVIPSILENSFEQFASRLKAIEQVAPLVEIDVMDGIFVDSQSFTDIEKINELNTPVKFQLHFMVENPLAEIEKWKKIKNISRVIFHIESKSDPISCLNAIRANCWQAGIALQTDTPLSAVAPYAGKNRATRRPTSDRGGRKNQRIRGFTPAPALRH